MMIEITDRAADELEQLCKAREPTHTSFVRLTPDGADELRMTFDAPLPWDVVITTGEHGRVILDAEIAMTFAASVLDVEASSHDAQQSGPAFVLGRKGDGNQPARNGKAR
jgi:hypothetical protein